MVKKVREKISKNVSAQVPPQSIEFMLTEYQRISALYETQVERGEKRVEFLITSVSALFGLLAVLSQLVVKMEYLIIITIASSIVLSLFGFMTLNRLINRAATMRFHMKRMSTIRDYFISLDNNISNYINLSRQPNQFKNKFQTLFQKVISQILDRSGLIETVILLNSIMISVLVIAIVHFSNGLNSSIQQMIFPGILSFLISGALQYIFSSTVVPLAKSIER